MVHPVVIDLKLWIRISTHRTHYIRNVVNYLTNQIELFCMCVFVWCFFSWKQSNCMEILSKSIFRFLWTVWTSESMRLTSKNTLGPLMSNWIITRWSNKKSSRFQSNFFLLGKCTRKTILPKYICSYISEAFQQSCSEILRYLNCPL